MNEASTDVSATTIEEELRRKIVILEGDIASWGIVEFMVRNPNVNSFVKEKEERIIKAESKIRELEKHERTKENGPMDELRTRIIERGKCLGVDWNELSWVLGQIDDIQKKEKK